MGFSPRLALLLAAVCLPAVTFADTATWQGRAVADFLDSLNEQGYRIIFSSDVVTSDLLIVHEPDPGAPEKGVRPVLHEHGLVLEQGPAGTWLVRRAAPAAAEASKQQAVQPALPEIVVTSSLHRLSYTKTGTQTWLDRELATRVPAAAEEAVRISNRLPSTAGGGISSRSHVRGGEMNEVLYLLDGLRLYEPFHLKDFQSVATIINSNAIDGLEFYSGAYPARYGDRMSSVVSMSLRQPEKSVETELALSFFNASVLSLGQFGSQQEGDWLLAARRGNLDLIADVIDPETGSPDYQDYILHGGWEFGPRAQLSANLLVSNDKLILADVDRGEFADASYENRVLWLRWDADWNERLRSETIISASTIANQRSGTLSLPGIVSGSLEETRDFDAVAFKQDWEFQPGEQWMLSFGAEGRHQDADYWFESTQIVAPPFDEILDNVPVLNRQFHVTPEGAQYGAWIEARVALRPGLILDAGLRWDHQSYTSASADEQFSPRLSLLYAAGDNTEIRLGWGRYAQAQEINELQVSDGVDSFFPAQRAEHVVANLKHRFANGTSVDLTIFHKNFRHVRPRYENAFNSLTLLPEIQFDRYRIDPSSAVADGAELQVSAGDAGEDVFWWIGYAWSEVYDRSAEQKILRGWDQTHALKFGLSWRWQSWDFSAAGEVHTGWPKSVFPGDVLNDDRYSIFHTLDVRVSREFDVRRGDLSVFLEVSNLYDRSNECCTEYSMTPDGLDARSAHWLPLLPSLGLVWRF